MLTFLSYSIDATSSSCLCRFINDSPPAYANCTMKKFEMGGMPEIFLVPTKDIPAGTELRYNYNDTNLPWRKKVSQSFTIKIADSSMFVNNVGK